MLQNVRSSGKMLRLASYGKVGIPDFSAKYCTYSLLDIDNDIIVTFVVVQVSHLLKICMKCLHLSILMICRKCCVILRVI